MSLSVGIVGFPNVGKSTLFQIITKKQVACENYPFCTVDANTGVVFVFDERVDEIKETIKSEKKTYTSIKFIDIAGLIKGASKGEGLGNKFLANIREVDVIVYVLRAFNDDNVINVSDEVNPLKEMELLETELILKDMETVEKKINFLKKEARSLKKEAVSELKVLEKVKGFLEKQNLLIEKDFSEQERKIISQYQFLTMKPGICVLNGKKQEVPKQLIEKLNKNNSLITDFIEEQEFINFTSKERISLGLPKESIINELIKKSYDLLGYISFFTAGEKETRAWKIKKGARAPEAGGIVHTDFEKGFIKAEVINWKDLVREKSFSEARKKGLIRIEGKNYIVSDGDVIDVKFKKN